VFWGHWLICMCRYKAEIFINFCNFFWGFWCWTRQSSLGAPSGISRIILAPGEGLWWVWSSRWNDWQRKQKYLGGKPATVPLCPPQIPHDQTCIRTRATAVRSQGHSELWDGLCCLFLELYCLRLLGYHRRSKNIVRKYTAVYRPQPLFCSSQPSLSVLPLGTLCHMMQYVL
jgi:hypothetical protein